MRPVPTPCVGSAKTPASFESAGYRDSVNQFPSLRVRTVRLEPGTLRQLWRYSDPHSPLVFLRNGDGIVGSGQILCRREFFGPDRIREAADAWSKLTSFAEVKDRAKVPGSGLVGFGAFAFSENSQQASVLIVPSLIVGRRDGIEFVTAITADSTKPDASLRDPAPLGPDERAVFETGEMDVVQHQQAVDHVVDLIGSGVLSKLVLARDLIAKLPEWTDRRHLIGRLAETYPDCWNYSVDGLTGASPETLVRVRGREVRARVLAGTAPRGLEEHIDRDIAEQLKSSPKNQQEHRFAVESALHALSSLNDYTDPGDSLTASPEPFLLALPNVWHLASDIRGTLPLDHTVLDLVQALHPTAAVGGTPRKAALEAIDRIEPFDRRRYAGPVGWIGAKGDGEWAIALRGAEIDPDGTTTAYAGGGIVATSVAADEFRETEWKLRPLQDALSSGLIDPYGDALFTDFGTGV